MKAEVKEKWVAALRSGKYQQGRMVLRTEDDKFCCLGVLCDLYAKERGDQWRTKAVDLNGVRALGFGDYNSLDYPPAEVRIWAGLDTSNPIVQTSLIPQGKTVISHLNDGEGKLDPQPFSLIADVIEAQL